MAAATISDLAKEGKRVRLDLVYNDGDSKEDDGEKYLNGSLKSA